LHYFANGERKPEPVAEILRRVAFPAEQRVPNRIDELLRRLGRR
jgi:hypothetical protein